MKQELRNHLARVFTDQELVKWFDPLRIELSETSRSLLVGFPHAFFADWFASTIQLRFEEQLGTFLEDGVTVRYETNGTGFASASPVPAQQVRVKRVSTPFGRSFTFDSFLTNSKNYFPKASAEQVAKEGNASFNPLVICGQSGSGKTHLLRATANEFARDVEPSRIFLGTVDDLVTLYTSKFNGDTFRAREHVSSFDFFLLDDLHAISRQESLQHELVALFDAYHDSGRQMAFTSATKLVACDFLNPKLKSRLEGGLIVNLKKPDLDVRTQFIKTECGRKNIELTKEQVLTLAQRFSDFRSLKGIVIKLIAYRELVNKNLSDKQFQRILEHSEDKPRTKLTPDMVIKVVADHFNLDPKSLKGSKRHHQIVKARQIAMYLGRQLINTSYPALGRVFGGKDHSTVLYAVNKIKELQTVNRDMNKLLIELKEKCLSLEES